MSMNDLNTLMIDGRITTAPFVVCDELEGNRFVRVAKMAIENTQRGFDGEDFYEDRFTLYVEIVGDLAELALEKLKEGMLVRLVGRLTPCGGTLELVARHIEFRLDDEYWKISKGDKKPYVEHTREITTDSLTNG